MDPLTVPREALYLMFLWVGHLIPEPLQQPLRTALRGRPDPHTDVPVTRVAVPREALTALLLVDTNAHRQTHSPVQVMARAALDAAMARDALTRIVDYTALLEQPNLPTHVHVNEVWPIRNTAVNTLAQMGTA